MQKVFDVDKKEDMDLLWSILPSVIVRITPSTVMSHNYGWFADSGNTSIYLIKINWHDKTEITRPVNYEDMIGCVVYFYNEPEHKSLGILKREIDGRPFIDELGGFWDYIEPVKKSELKFYGEQDDQRTEL